MKVAIYLAQNIFLPLVLMTAASAADSSIQKKLELKEQEKE